MTKPTKSSPVPSEPGYLQRLVRLRDVRTWWLVGAGVAMVLHALGIVGIETVAGALWFPGWTFLCLAITTQPNPKLSGPDQGGAT